MQKNMHAKRVRSLIVLSVISAVILSVSTYAWFIGMRTVNVSSFDVTIKTTESLMLSLNGTEWSYSVDLSDKTALESAYTGNTNKWSSLIPVSTVGDMDVTASRMKLFEKTSYTATKGGYRLISTRMENNIEDPENAGKLLPEEDGYLVFDLFIRNFSGNDYIQALNVDDEEAIYLTKESTAAITHNGTEGIDNTGVENSIRVAFTQIGRVVGTTTTPATITGITCNPKTEGEDIVPSVVGEVTGICRTATIWEPNDTEHVEGAINYYETACKARTGAEIRGQSANYSTTAGSCTDIINGTAYPTYAIKDEIGSVDKVDIYDGEEYNTYEGTTKLVPFDTFSDSDKNLPGKSRPTFMTLAANSITKVRIYVYIEGQDIDNYNFSEIGKHISITFGFTKERLVGDDIDYAGPELPAYAED